MSATPFRWRSPVATTAVGLLLDEVVHDREVVRREVPEDVDVVLEQAEVHAGRVVVVQLAQGAVVDHLLHAADGAGEQKGVVHHDLEVLALGEFDELFALRDGAGERLFDEHVLAVLEGFLGEFEVSPNRRYNRDQVDVGRGQQVIDVVGGDHVGIRMADLAERFLALVANRDDASLVLRVEVPNDVRTPIAVADDAYAQQILSVFCFDGGK